MIKCVMDFSGQAPKGWREWEESRGGGMGVGEHAKECGGNCSRQ